MAPEFQAVARATQTWLQTTWNIQVPSAWLEACVEWLQEEAGGPGRLLQQQVNQQVGEMFVRHQTFNCNILGARKKF